MTNPESPRVPRPRSSGFAILPNREARTDRVSSVRYQRFNRQPDARTCSRPSLPVTSKKAYVPSSRTNFPSRRPLSARTGSRSSKRFSIRAKTSSRARGLKSSAPSASATQSSPSFFRNLRGSCAFWRISSRTAIRRAPSSGSFIRIPSRPSSRRGRARGRRSASCSRFSTPCCG